MALVGQKSIFAIEWYINSHCENWFDANMRFWANGKEIGAWSEDEPIQDSVWRAQRNVQRGIYQHTLPIDYSNFSKEDVFWSIFECSHHATFPEKYHDIYREWKARFAAEFEERADHRYEVFHRKLIEVLMAEGNPFAEDFSLFNWISGSFNITDDITENISKYYYLLRVQDIAFNQERLVWKAFDQVDDDGNVEYEYPVEEAVLPVGYFEKVVRKFVEVASDEMERIKNGDEYVDSGWIVV